ncbi:rho guanine nucleotide exchange factor 18-like [Sphaeramia orbicularis]|uniref:Rho guanine nucleotide exchange factor 18-like n=1 Tax=Sphaeramia orbicularis TaxID=375764 RepID=A0A672Z6V9_9TELE|nr:rho guanine nucleotide exchange factor 18-like [Sphaeramia orbicularis]XP_030017116.1 rho guanine nucleotide exchange factor 18-like [Sphaeramia orbicularis]
MQMDEVEGIRVKLFSEDAVSLAPSLAESINLEDGHYTQLRLELESDAQNLEADSWSMAVDQNYMKALHKEAIKRQDVIYELIQTEMHHVRTLKILLCVYIHELKQSALIEEGRLESLFPGVDALLSLHQHFLNSLKTRQTQSQEEGTPNKYQITQLGDILIAQFSGTLGEGMKEWYSIFCSHHTQSVSFYKEQLQNSKKLQNLIRKIGQLPLVRRLGIPECFLLVTQRITKYPVLVERIIQNTEADTDEYKSLVQGLALIKDTISQVNAQVSEYEKAARLREICSRLEPKSQGRIMGERFLRREELMQNNRTLLHEGALMWKSSGRQKDIHAVLLSDVLLLLQEKDQKLVFAAVDNKPPVISLRGLIVREVAHEDKAMYLICACTSNMYEIHTGSRNDCITWTTLIREAVNCFTEEEEQYSEQTTVFQQYQDSLKERDEQIKQSLEEKQQLIVELYETVTGRESSHRGLLLRGDASDLQQGETLLRGAINEVENVQGLLMMRIKKTQIPQRTEGGADGNPTANALKNGDPVDRPGSSEVSVMSGTHINPDHQLQEIYYSESVEQSADGDVDEDDDDDDDDDDTQMPQCSLSSTNQIPDDEVCDRVILLAQRLYSLQAIIAQQDSQIVLQQASQSKSKRVARHYSSALLEQENQRNTEKQKQELANLHKMQAQQREEQQRWEKDKERQRIQMETLEAEVRQREEECRRREEKLNEEKAELERQKENYQHDLERLRESLRGVEKEEERQTQERERLEKIKRNTSFLKPGLSNPDDHKKHLSLSSFPSFRGSGVNGTATPNPYVLPSVTASDPKEIPPKVPPRRESISPQVVKQEVPIHLISTTNQVLKPAVVQQQIPTKLATLGKGKEKGFKSKGSHQRTNSAASIDVNQVLPIRVTGKEGGSLRAKRTSSPPRIYQSDLFKPSETVPNVKPSPSFISHKRSHSDAPPPVPPPFPKDVLETSKEKVIFL